MRVADISGALTTQPEEGKYYLLEQDRGNTMTPAGDTGEGGTITRASSADAVSVGDMASDVESYLLRFIPTGYVSSTGLGGVYRLQWATGNYWVSIEGVTDGTGITTTSDAEEAGFYNVYPTTTGGNLFGLNAYDMGKLVDNNGAGGILTGWGDGQNTATSGNNVWTIYEVTFEEMSDEYWELRDLVAEAQAAYAANEDVAVALISSTEQFSSPYTYEGSLDNLLDGNADTFWHSDWSAAVPDGTHYIQVDLADDFVGGDLILSILRRNNQNNQVVKMSIKDGEDNLIDTVDLPYNGQGETVEAEFTCPEGIYTLRFYNEETVGNTQYGQGFFHLAGLQLYYADRIIGNNTKYPEVAAALAAAIAEAQTIIVANNATADDVAAMQEALDTYLAEIAPLLSELIAQYEADLAEADTLVAELEESIEINRADEAYDADILAEMEEALAGLQEAISTYGNIDTAATTKEEPKEAIAALEAAMETASNAYATAISGVATSTEGDDVIYTIGGMRVSKATKGVYIVNGKKVLVK